MNANQRESSRRGMARDTIARAVKDHLVFSLAKDIDGVTARDVYVAISLTVRDRLVQRWRSTVRTYRDEQPKRVYYLSAEYLLGRQLKKNLLNLGLLELMGDVIDELGWSLSDVFEQEPDPGLGNGGLGRLAACFLDSMATMGLPGYGYGIRYEFGIFRQAIVDGRQVEKPDDWLRHDNPWEFARPEYTVPVRFGGNVVDHIDDSGKHVFHWVNSQVVFGVPYDTPVQGYDTNTVNTLRLWRARASEDFDLAVFNDGDYRLELEQKSLSESISKVLYPNDRSPEGRELRLKQQVFFVTCAIADILRRHLEEQEDISSLPEYVAIQLNDTHPAIAVAELMRVLVDEYALEWDDAWSITTRVCAYTNHTLLPEALEKWPLRLFERLLPRHLQIIYEINRRHLLDVHIQYPGDQARQKTLSIIEESYGERHVRMAHLSVVGSHSVNGVAALHSKLVVERLMPEFYELYPKKFNNKTNGVTPRRWLRGCNPGLSGLITEAIGQGWVTDLDKLEGLIPLANDSAFLERIGSVKQLNKRRLVEHCAAQLDIPAMDPSSLFDVQIKRIHEYKRQLMLALYAVHLYRRVKFLGETIQPRTILFGGKAAPGYQMAKQHIKLINDISAIVNRDRDVNQLLQLHFLPDYNVSLAERIIPATDLSEQISMAGKEASGTGNMKFQMNGALTLGTLDGANIEIREAVGAEHFFLFGHDAEEISAIRSGGYRPRDHVESSTDLQAAIRMVEEGLFSPDEPDRYASLVRYLLTEDPFCVCADFDSYVAAQELVGQHYSEQQLWLRSVVLNIANSGRFSSDRTIGEYARDIWNVHPISVELDG